MVAQKQQIAKHLCKAVKAYRFVHGDHVFDIGVSIGLVEITENTMTVEQLFGHADAACYAAKSSGRNQVRVYEKDNDDISVRSGEMYWVSRILDALKEKRLVIFAQKINSIATGTKYCHFEILVRLLDEEGKVVSPDDFLPAAERYNLMDSVDPKT